MIEISARLVVQNYDDVDHLLRHDQIVRDFAGHRIRYLAESGKRLRPIGSTTNAANVNSGAGVSRAAIRCRTRIGAEDCAALGLRLLAQAYGADEPEFSGGESTRSGDSSPSGFGLALGGKAAAVLDLEAGSCFPRLFLSDFASIQPSIIINRSTNGSLSRRHLFEPANSLFDWRMSREQPRESLRAQRIDDKQMRRRRARIQRHPLIGGLELAQCVREIERIVREAGAAGVGLVFASARNRELDQRRRDRREDCLRSAAPRVRRVRRHRGRPIPKIAPHRIIEPIIMIAPASVAAIELVRMSRLITCESSCPMTPFSSSRVQIRMIPRVTATAA